MTVSALRRHGWFVGVLTVGAALRALAMLGYRPALWFPDSYSYVVTVMRPRPDLVRPAGYSFFMKLLEPFHSFAVVAGAQHLLGLATGVLVYWLAVRHAPRWLATLAAAPVLLDAYQIELEHLLVSDTLFIALVTAAIVLALRERPPAVVIGLLLAAAALTRTIGLPLVALVFLWFLLRRDPRKAVALLMAAAVPIVAYGGWFYATYHRVGLVGANGVFLYSRTMAFADCHRMKPPPDLAVLCDPRPADRRPPSQEYVWSRDSPLKRLPGETFGKETDDKALRFALLAIRTQPLDYLASVLRELGRTFTWDRPVFPNAEVYGYYQFPAQSPPPPGRYAAKVGAEFAKEYERGEIGTRVVEPWAGWMRTYQGFARLPGTLLLLILLVPPAAALRRTWRNRRDPERSPERNPEHDPERPPAKRPTVPAAWTLPWVAAWALLLAPAAVAEFDYRYVLPAVPLALLAAVLSTARKP